MTERSQRKVRVGVVVSDARDKTIAVEIESHAAFDSFSSARREQRRPQG